MSVEAEVLAANAAFYDAFSRRDVAAMEALWAVRAPVACVHPGWDALRGRDEVMTSWRAILENPRAPRVECQDATAHVLGGLAFVVCIEEISGAELVATNVYVLEDGRWRMAHHHAGPVAHRREPDEEARPPRKEELN